MTVSAGGPAREPAPPAADGGSLSRGTPRKARVSGPGVGSGERAGVQRFATAGCRDTRRRCGGGGKRAACPQPSPRPRNHQTDRNQPTYEADNPTCAPASSLASGSRPQWKRLSLGRCTSPGARAQGPRRHGALVEHGVQLATAQRATPGSSYPPSVAKGTNARLSRALSTSRSSSGSAGSTIANGPATSMTHCS